MISQHGHSFESEFQRFAGHFDEKIALAVLRSDLDQQGRTLEHAAAITAQALGPNEIEISISGQGSSRPPGLDVYHIHGTSFDVRAKPEEVGLAVMAPFHLTRRFTDIQHSGSIEITTSAGAQQIKVAS